MGFRQCRTALRANLVGLHLRDLNAEPLLLLLDQGQLLRTVTDKRGGWETELSLKPKEQEEERAEMMHQACMRRLLIIPSQSRPYWSSTPPF